MNKGRKSYLSWTKWFLRRLCNKNIEEPQNSGMPLFTAVIRLQSYSFTFSYLHGPRFRITSGHSYNVPSFISYIFSFPIYRFRRANNASILNKHRSFYFYLL
ncbi:hypothetical protein Hanom_Chr09g00831611 [Helianthus anomalus]